MNPGSEDDILRRVKEKAMARLSVAEKIERFGDAAGKSVSQRDAPVYPSKNRPMPKYVRDKWNVADIHSGPNRHERRAANAARKD